MNEAPLITVTPVEPAGERGGYGFVSYTDGTSGVGPVMVKEWPASPRGREIGKARSAAGLLLRQAAAVFGLSAVDLSGLEHGRFVTEQWDEILEYYKEFSDAG